MIPGVEVAKALRGRGWECVFLGTARGFENRLVPAEGFALHTLRAGSLQRVSLARRLRTVLSAPAALGAALRIVGDRRPQVALSLGGYAAGPLVAACALLDVPLVVLEPNATPGLANRLAALAARRALLGHPGAASFFRLASCQVTGLPVREAFFRVRPRPPGGRLAVLVLGGSQGAARLNAAAVAAARLWRRSGRDVPRLVHQTGARDRESVARAYAELGVDAVVSTFFDEMAAVLSKCDLVVCRAGASVIAELCAAGKPAVLVPFPHAADDHQVANASVLAAAGAGLLVEDRDWTGERMVEEVDRLAADRSRLALMASRLAPLAPVRACEDVVDALEAARNRAGIGV